MKMIFKLGLRNIFRNTRRSLLASLAVGVGLFAVIFTDGLMIGMFESMIRTTTSSLVSEAQIHNEEFKDSGEVEYTIKNHEELERVLSEDILVKAFSKRAITFSMIASPRNTRNVQLYGVDTEAESKVNLVHKYMSEGEFKVSKGGIILGKKLFEDLELRMNERVVVTVAEAHTGELSQAQYRVEGVISFGSDAIDRALAFTSLSNVQGLLGIGDKYHEIAMTFGDSELSKNNELPLWKSIKETGNLGESWNELVPGIESMIEMSSLSMVIVISIVVILVSIGVINTLFMSIFERMFEFGVLRALGTKGKEVVLMILSEAFGIGILSSILGLVLVGTVGTYFASVGLDYGGVEVNSVTFREPIKLIFEAYHFYLFPLLAILFTCIVGIYPALYCTKIDVNYALKKSL